MAEPRLIGSYLAALSTQLPVPVVEELADGLAETLRCYVRQGLDPDRAAECAVAEFGDPREIVAAFACVNPARRAARRLLGTGPAVGGCWAAALITSRAWLWPVPPGVPVLFGVALAGVIGLLAVAALGPRYRLAARAGAAGCIGLTALDAVMIITAMLLTSSVTWVTLAAVAASGTRIAFSTWNLRPVLAG
jgi:hypothetical protein